jgi:hypothetical protein
MTTLVPVPNDGRGFAEFNALVASQNRFREIEFDRDQDEVGGGGIMTTAAGATASEEFRKVAGPGSRLR